MCRGNRYMESRTDLPKMNGVDRNTDPHDNFNKLSMIFPARFRFKLGHHGNCFIEKSQPYSLKVVARKYNTSLSSKEKKCNKNMC